MTGYYNTGCGSWVNAAALRISFVHVCSAVRAHLRCPLRDPWDPFSTRGSMTASLCKLLRLGFTIANLAVSHIPRWLASGVWIMLYEDRKGNWTLGRHLRVQMKRHMPGVWNK